MFLKEGFLQLILKFTINLQHDSLTHYNEYIKWCLQLILYVQVLKWFCTFISLIGYQNNKNDAII